MRNFLEIYFGIFIILPLLFCIVVYMLVCFITWSILQPGIEWDIVRLYMIVAFIVSIFLAADK